MKNNSDSKKPCYTAEELRDIGPELDAIIKKEISKGRETLTCVAGSIGRSESLESLTIGLQRFSLAYSTVLERTVNSIIARVKGLHLPSFPSFLLRNAITLSILERVKDVLRPIMKEALQYAKNLGRKFGADSISVTVGFPFILQFTINLKTL